MGLTSLRGVTVTEISIHDDAVTGYMVDCEKREITLHTKYQDKTLNERTDICFSGVEAYQLTGENFYTILGDVEEIAIDQLLKDSRAEFEEGVRYGWPGMWNISADACRERFSEHGCKGWVISSAVGMAGFVVAKRMEIVGR